MPNRVSLKVAEGGNSSPPFDLISHHHHHPPPIADLICCRGELRARSPSINLLVVACEKEVPNALQTATATCAV